MCTIISRPAGSSRRSHTSSGAMCGPAEKRAHEDQVYLIKGPNYIRGLNTRISINLPAQTPAP